MSKFSRLFQTLGAVREFADRVRGEMPKMAPLLDALQADDHEAAWQILSAYGDVREVLERVPAVAKPYVPMIGPFLMEALDELVDEDQVEKFLQGVGLFPA